MTRGERWGSIALGGAVRFARSGDGWALSGIAPLVDGVDRADVFLVIARSADGLDQCFAVERDAHRLAVGEPRETIGTRGLGAGDLALDGVVVVDSARLADGAVTLAEALVHLGSAATAVGLAQAAFEAALRYSQQRSAFGQPICQHQAIQLKLADMATRITAARLLTSDAAERVGRDGGRGVAARMARVEASEAAAMVTLESMRIHGGYGYTAEFPVERLYRDAARLLVVPGDGDLDRRAIASHLVASGSERPTLR